ncbi:hypothetical protein OPV22_001097 [Ensete ventricosum]|uniref:Uncharacterized protein n=1 Tax=Ensete ventricosum TaxID=4639 RepID=A0AAV8RSY4_ENSVE|nr:hypothetical protein OPV22_001097 [Ensete ventricosum]
MPFRKLHFFPCCTSASSRFRGLVMLPLPARRGSLDSVEPGGFVDTLSSYTVRSFDVFERAWRPSRGMIPEPQFGSKFAMQIPTDAEDMCCFAGCHLASQLFSRCERDWALLIISLLFLSPYYFHDQKRELVIAEIKLLSQRSISNI